MTRLYHPQWLRANGEAGGDVFREWSAELLPFGSEGVLQGIEAVRAEGNQYVPNLNKFRSYCKTGKGWEGGTGRTDAFGVVRKPTPQGMPLVWTWPANYTIAELQASPCEEDHRMAEQLRIEGKTHFFRSGEQRQ